MTDLQTSDRDVSRAIRSWLHEDRHEDASRVSGTVLDRVETTPQRRAGWPAWRTPTMNRFLTFGFGAAVVLIAMLLGWRALGLPTNVGGPVSSAAATPLPSAGSATATPAPSGSARADLPEGPHLLWRKDLGVTIELTIPAPGWYGKPGEGTLTKNDNVDAPDGAGLIVFAATNDLLVGLGDVYVYEDPCHWESTRPETPVTTVDEAIAALSSQPSRDASPPQEITLDGFTGKRITLRVPDDVVFSECDRGEFRTLVQGEDAARHHQDPGQLDLLWILDVNGQIVIFDMVYYEGTPEAVLDEMAAMVESATLQYSP